MDEKMRKWVSRSYLGVEEAEVNARIRSKGRMVIPKDVRDALGIEEGSLLRCRIRKVVDTVGEDLGKGTRVGTVEKTGRPADLVLNALDKTITQIFKKAGAEAIYNYLEIGCHLKREEIAKKPEVFSAGLGRLLNSGAPFIENLILKNLYRKFGFRIEEKKGYEFSDCIKELVEKIQSSKHEDMQAAVDL